MHNEIRIKNLLTFNYSVKIRQIVLFLMLFALFRLRIFPETARTVIKVFGVIITLLYLFRSRNRRILINESIILSASVFLSCLLNYLFHHASFSAFLDGIMNALCHYCLYSMFLYFVMKNAEKELIHSIYTFTAFYCFLALLFINVSFGYSAGDSNLKIYLLGNKFSTGYFFLALPCFYFLDKTYDNNDGLKKKETKIILFFLYFLAVGISMYYDCMTIVVASLPIIAIIILFRKHIDILFNRGLIISIITLSAVIPTFIRKITYSRIWNDFVMGLINRSKTLTGRIRIYERFLYPTVAKRWLYGYGYTNSAIRTVSLGRYGNAQNGIMDYIIKYGLIGAIFLIIIIILFFKNKKQNSNLIGPVMLFYSMLLAGIVEVSFNWIFFTSLFLIGALNRRNNIQNNKKRNMFKIGSNIKQMKREYI